MTIPTGATQRIILLRHAQDDIIEDRNVMFAARQRLHDLRGQVIKLRDKWIRADALYKRRMLSWLDNLQAEYAYQRAQLDIRLQEATIAKSEEDLKAHEFWVRQLLSSQNQWHAPATAQQVAEWDLRRSRKAVEPDRIEAEIAELDHRYFRKTLAQAETLASRHALSRFDLCEARYRARRAELAITHKQSEVAEQEADIALSNAILDASRATWGKGHLVNVTRAHLELTEKRLTRARHNLAVLGEDLAFYTAALRDYTRLHHRGAVSAETLVEYQSYREQSDGILRVRRDEIPHFERDVLDAKKRLQQATGATTRERQR